jgi:hypothetical protein
MDLSTFIVAIFCLIDDRLVDFGRLSLRFNPADRQRMRKAVSECMMGTPWNPLTLSTL